MSHNPEFTTCEFYQAYADLEVLIDTTERMLTTLHELASDKISHMYKSLEPTKWDPKAPPPQAPFPRLDFVPALEEAINDKSSTPSTLDAPGQTETRRRLPDLSSTDAVSGVLELFQDLGITPPATPTLARLLDKLSTIYLERPIRRPTFIINHPECLSPLAKSFLHPLNGQRVAARAELFISGLEIANMYEEENSPFEQRRKFQQQLSSKDGETAEDIDESYLEALEWGLPPTGGCSISPGCW